MTHEIKLTIGFCDLVYKGVKTFEVRRNDRGYKIGDLVKFNPVDVLFQPVEHPIKDKVYRITYILQGWGIQEGFCVFAIEENKPSEEETEDAFWRQIIDTDKATIGADIGTSNDIDASRYKEEADK